MTYLGPLIIFFIFYLLHDDIYSFTLNEPHYFESYSWLHKCESAGRWYGFYMIIVHFIKRLLECIIIHNFSRNTKTFSRLIWEMAYYWLFCGVGITYYLLHPNYQKPLWEVESLYFVKYILIASFIFCELMNL